MDGMQREELERLMFFEQTREKAAASYARNPKDADVFFFSPLCFFFFFFFFFKL
jgi:membrane protein insertase Oxa1/YidC/SpoIIIJ